MIRSMGLCEEPAALSDPAYQLALAQALALERRAHEQLANLLIPWLGA